MSGGMVFCVLQNNRTRANITIPGKTIPTPDCKRADVDADLDIETLTNDFVNLLTTVYMDPASAPSLLVRWCNRE